MALAPKGANPGKGVSKKGARFVPLLSWIGCDDLWRLTGDQCFQRFLGAQYAMRKVQPTCVVSLIGHISATKIKWSDFLRRDYAFFSIKEYSPLASLDSIN